MRNILVLGGAGFIGSNLVRALVRGGERVRVLTRPSRTIANLHDVLDRVELIHGDFMDDGIVRAALRDADVVFHLITTTFPNMTAASSNYDLLSNLLPTIRLLDMCQHLGVKRIVYASSGGTVYGEPRFMPISEDHPLAPESAYGQSKLTIENYLSFYARSTPLEVSILRLSNPYGPGQNRFGVQGLIAVAMGCLRDGRPMGVFGDGEAVRDYIYIDDVVEAMLLAADSPPNVFNVSSGIGFTVLDVLDAIETIAGAKLRRRPLPARPGDVRVNVLDNRRACEVLGWSPKISLDEGLRRTWRSTGAGMESGCPFDGERAIGGV